MYVCVCNMVLFYFTFHINQSITVIYAYMCIYVYVYICTYVCMCVYIYMYMCVYIYMYNECQITEQLKIQPETSLSPTKKLFHVRRYPSLKYL